MLLFILSLSKRNYCKLHPGVLHQLSLYKFDNAAIKTHKLAKNDNWNFCTTMCFNNLNVSSVYPLLFIYSF